jgi:hypothetical protein
MCSSVLQIRCFRSEDLTFCVCSRMSQSAEAQWLLYVAPAASHFAICVPQGTASIGILTRLRAARPRNRVSILLGGQEICFPRRHVHTGCWTYRVCYKMSAVHSLPGGTEAGHEVDDLPPPKAVP